MVATILTDANALLIKLNSIYSLSDEDQAAVQQVPIQAVEFGADQDVVRTGDHPTRCCLVIRGFAAVYKLSGDGQRQISAFKIPGDVPDLHSLHLRELDSSIATLTPCRIGFLRHEDLIDLCGRHARVAHALWRNTLIDAAILREWLGNIGQRPAYPRIAHLLCEILVRMGAMGLADGDECDFPITQTELADATGMSPVHVNRTLQELRSLGLIQLRDNRLAVLDRAQLMRAADFNPRYLNLP